MIISSTKSLYASATGGGLHMRHPRWADYEQWVDLRRKNRDYLSPWEPEWKETHLTRPSYKSRLSQFKKMVSSGEGYPFHLFRAEDERMIGACNITYVHRAVSQSAMLGYWIGQDYARQGFARAAVRAACRFCFDDLGLHRVAAGVQPDNAPSIKVLESAGFQREGTARGFLKIDGEWRDHIIFARLSSD